MVPQIAEGTFVKVIKPFCTVAMREWFHSRVVLPVVFGKSRNVVFKDRGTAFSTDNRFRYFILLVFSSLVGFGPIRIIPFLIGSHRSYVVPFVIRSLITVGIGYMSNSFSTHCWVDVRCIRGTLHFPCIIIVRFGIPSAPAS